MSAFSSPIPLFLKQIRDVLKVTPTLIADVQPFVEQAYGLLSLEDEHDPETGIHRSDLAYTLAGILELTFDPSMIRMGLGLLLKLGPVGEGLAVSYIHKTRISKDAVRAILQPFPEMDKLYLLNRIFRNPLGNDGWLLEWAYENVRELQGGNPDAVLLFLKELPARGGCLSYPLQRALMKGRFGVWLQQLLAMQLDDEQLEFMMQATKPLQSHFVALALLKFINKAGPRLLPNIISTIGVSGKKQDKGITKALIEIFRLENGPSADNAKLQALEGLDHLRSPQTARVAAYAYKTAPRLRKQLMLRVLLGKDNQLSAFMRTIPLEEHRDVILFLTSVLAAVAPDWLEQTVKNMQARKDAAQDWEQLPQIMLEYLSELPRVRLEPYFTPRKRKQAATKQPEGIQQKVHGLLNFVKSTLEGQPLQKDATKEKEFFKALESVEPLQNVTYKAMTLDEFICQGAVFTKVKFIDLTMRSAAFSNTQFINCRFNNVNFELSTFKSVEFIGCELSHCRFSESRCKEMAFEDCSLRLTHFAGCAMLRLTSKACRFMECDFSGARLQEWKAVSCSFANSNFSSTTLLAPWFNGLEFVGCRFDKTFCKGGATRNSIAPASTFYKCRFMTLDTDVPEFQERVRLSLHEAFTLAADSTHLTEPPPLLGSAEGIQFLYSILDSWMFEQEIARNQQLFLANNQKRIDWTYCMLGKPAMDFFKILPALFEIGPQGKKTDAKGNKEEPLPVFDIHHYRPDASTLSLLEKYGLAYPKQRKRRPSSVVSLEALYAIGSTGTIAQAQSSDIDLWACYDAHAVSVYTRRQLKEKLAHLEKWAMDVFGLEVHVFLMDLKSIRENNFGYTDKESSGSTQAQLLKEEFYRTGVYLAGKKHAWWLFNADTTDAEYVENLRRVRNSATLLDKDVLDMGHMYKIPKDEFFGASLWQIVKAMRSPFKSVMKLALLDKYIHGKNVDVFLCNRIKQAVFLGHTDLWYVDPYAVMFREVFEYYRSEAESDAQDLMRLSFLQKTGIYLAPHGTGRFYDMQEYSFMEFFFPYSEAEIASHIDPEGSTLANSASKQHNSFAERVALGEKLVHYMFTTYNTIQQLWGQLDMDALVTQEDMTRLGRKIFSTMRKRKNKVMRLPFTDASYVYFSSLEFSYETPRGQSPVWTVTGEQPKQAQKRAVKEVLHKDRSLERMLVWLTANGVYTPDTQIISTNMAKHISNPDILDLIQVLSHFFNHKETFDRDINENLRPEEIIKACIIINFTAARENTKHYSAVLIYSTNWGELFCVPDPKGVEVIQQSPYRFIKINSNTHVPEEVEINIFIPEKAMCPEVLV